MSPLPEYQQALIRARELITSGRVAQGLDVIEDAASGMGPANYPAQVVMQRSIHQPVQCLQSIQNAKDDQQKANIKGQGDTDLEHCGSFWGGAAILFSSLLKFLLWVFLPRSSGVLHDTYTGGGQA
jgi:hypothetical protein